MSGLDDLNVSSLIILCNQVVANYLRNPMWGGFPIFPCMDCRRGTDVGVGCWYGGSTA